MSVGEQHKYEMCRCSLGSNGNEEICECAPGLTRVHKTHTSCGFDLCSFIVESHNIYMNAFVSLKALLWANLYAFLLCMNNRNEETFEVSGCLQTAGKQTQVVLDCFYLPV